MFVTARTMLPGLFPPALHQRIVTFHAEDALGGPCIFEVLDLLLTIPTAEARGTKSLIACQDGQILDLVVACAATVGTIVADQGAIAEQKEVCVGIEEGAAGVASETVNVPSIAGCEFLSFTASQ